MLLHPLVSENAKSSSLLQPHQIVFATQCSPCISVKQKQPQPNWLQQHRIVATPTTICHANPENGCYSSLLLQLKEYKLQQKKFIAIWPHITTTDWFGGNIKYYCTQFSGVAIVLRGNRGKPCSVSGLLQHFTCPSEGWDTQGRQGSNFIHGCGARVCGILQI